MGAELYLPLNARPQFTLRWVLAPRQGGRFGTRGSYRCCFGISQCAHLDSEPAAAFAPSRDDEWTVDQAGCAHLGHGGVRVSPVLLRSPLTCKLRSPENLSFFFFAHKD